MHIFKDLFNSVFSERCSVGKKRVHFAWWKNANYVISIYELSFPYFRGQLPPSTRRQVTFARLPLKVKKRSRALATILQPLESGQRGARFNNATSINLVQGKFGPSSPLFHPLLYPSPLLPPSHFSIHILKSRMNHLSVFLFLLIYSNM